MADQDKEKIENFCKYVANNWINGEYNKSYLNIKIDKNGEMVFFTVQKDCTNWDK